MGNGPVKLNSDNNVLVLRRFSLFLAVVILLGAIAGCGGGGAGSAPVTVSPGDTKNDEEQQLFSEVFSIVESSFYYSERIPSKYADASSDQVGSMLAEDFDDINDFLESLDDPYTRYLTPSSYENMAVEVRGQFGGTGIAIGINKDTDELEIIRVFDDTPAADSGLKTGDVIEAIDGISTENMYIDDATSLIRGDVGTTVVLTINREGAFNNRDFSVVRDVITLPNIEYEMMDNNMGYIVIFSFTSQTESQFVSAYNDLAGQGMNGLILDLRENPGGLLDASIDVADLFVPPDTALVIRENTAGDQLIAYSKNAVFVAEPMVTLVNGWTASAAEILASVLQENNVSELVGETTCGKGSVQKLYSLSNDGAVLVTTDIYKTGEGKSLNEVGIDPDHKVSQGDDENTDLQLEYAKNLLLAAIASRIVPAAVNY